MSRKGSVDGGASTSVATSGGGESEEIPEINEVVVQTLIHQKLDEVRSGDLYVMHNLKDDSVHELLTDPTVYKKFESLIAKTWMDIDLISNNESGLNGGKLNRKKKMYTKALKADSHFVRGQIQDYIHNMASGGQAQTPSKSHRSASLPHDDDDEDDHGGHDQHVHAQDDDIHHHRHHHHHQQNHDVDSEEDDNDNDNDMDQDTVSSLSDGKVSRSSSSQKRKKKKKHKKRKHKDKKKSRKSKKRKRHKSSSSSRSHHDDSDDLEEEEEEEEEGEEQLSMDDEDMEEEEEEEEERELTPREEKRLRRRREKAKVVFEKERVEIMEQIPEKDKKEFRTLGFGKWGKDFLPVMLLGPYDAPPGNVREQWMKMFENTLRNSRPMSRLVFWYGTPKNDLSNSFSFIPKGKFVSYDEGKKKKLDQIPAKVEKKLKSGKKLTASETMLVDGLRDQLEDSNKEPNDRSAWLLEFEEDYDDYMDQIDDETSDEEDDEEEHRRRMKKESQQNDLGSEKKRKKKKKQKQKHAPKETRMDEDDGSEYEKKSKKRKRDKSGKASSVSSTTKKTSKKPKKSKSLDEEIEEEVAEEDAMMEEMREDPPSEDDEDDGDFQQDDNEELSDEEDGDDDNRSEDDDYEEKHRSKPKQKSKSSSAKKAKKSKTKDVVESSSSSQKPKTKKSKKERKSTSPCPDIVKEQELFEECENIFLPLMSMLKEVYVAHEAERLIRKIDRDVQKLTPSFIREHQIGIVVKEVRSQFKDSAEVNQLCKQLTSKMKKVYHAKRESEPKDFVPKVKKSTLKKKKKKEKTEVDSTRVKSPIDERATVADSVGNSAKSGKSSSSAPVTIKELSIPSQKAQKIPSTREEVMQKMPAQTIPIADEDMKDSTVNKVQVVPPIKKVVKTPKADRPKQARKSFSLAGMLAPTATPTPTSKIEKDVEIDTSPSHHRVEVQEDEQRPKWIINYQPTGPNTYEHDPDRSFAMEFLMEAVRCFPEGKVDPTSVARALEDALWTRYDGDYGKYMERVHDVCAAIAGKKQLGSVAQKIISGDYTTPLDVINIPRKLLFQSFEGFWIP